ERDEKVRKAPVLRKLGKVARMVRAIGPGRAGKVAHDPLVGDPGEQVTPVLRPAGPQKQAFAAKEHGCSPLSPAPRPHWYAGKMTGVWRFAGTALGPSILRGVSRENQKRETGAGPLSLWFCRISQAAGPAWAIPSGWPVIDHPIIRRLPPWRRPRRTCGRACHHGSARARRRGRTGYGPCPCPRS